MATRMDLPIPAWANRSTPVHALRNGTLKPHRKLSKKPTESCLTATIRQAPGLRDGAIRLLGRLHMYKSMKNLAQPSPINEQHHFGGPLVGQLSGNTLMAPNYPGQHSHFFLIIWANSSGPDCAGLRVTTEKGLLISGSQVRALLGSPLFSNDRMN